MGSVDADDELFASITWKRHFELVPLLHLPCREPFFVCNLVVDPLTDPDGTLAHCRVRLGWLNRKKLLEHARRLSVGIRCKRPTTIWLDV